MESKFTVAWAKQLAAMALCDTAGRPDVKKAVLLKAHAERMTRQANKALAAVVRRENADAVAASGGMRRKVWDLIPLGYEVDMLWLHLRTLEPVVDGFLVTEATTTHTGDEPKPTILHDAVKNGSVPSAAIAQKLHVRVVESGHDDRVEAAALVLVRDERREQLVQRAALHHREGRPRQLPRRDKKT